MNYSTLETNRESLEEKLSHEPVKLRSQIIERDYRKFRDQAAIKGSNKLGQLLRDGLWNQNRDLFQVCIEQPINEQNSEAYQHNNKRRRYEAASRSSKSQRISSMASMTVPERPWTACARPSSTATGGYLDTQVSAAAQQTQYIAFSTQNAPRASSGDPTRLISINEQIFMAQAPSQIDTTESDFDSRQTYNLTNSFPYPENEDPIVATSLQQSLSGSVQFQVPFEDHTVYNSLQGACFLRGHMEHNSSPSAA